MTELQAIAQQAFDAARVAGVSAGLWFAEGLVTSADKHHAVDRMKRSIAELQRAVKALEQDAAGG